MSPRWEATAVAGELWPDLSAPMETWFLTALMSPCSVSRGWLAPRSCPHQPAPGEVGPASP